MMCWKYEDEYDECWDHLTGQIDHLENQEGSFAIWLEENYNVHIEDRDTFDQDLLKLFTKWHEEGTIKPKNTNR